MIRANIGGLDTAIRASLGGLAIVVAAVGADQYPVVALATALGAAVILATAIVGVCPVYAAFGLDTRPRSRPQPPRDATTVPQDSLPVRVLCPATGGTALVRVAISVAQPALVVVACERFPDGVLRCDGECFPLDLMRRRPVASALRA